MNGPISTLFLLAAVNSTCLAQTVPQPYRSFFTQFVDNRSLPEKALNTIGLTGKDIGRSFALIVGVSSYPNLPAAHQDLSAARADVRQLQVYLQTQEFFDEVVVLKDKDVNYETLRYFLEIYFPERLKAFPRSRFLFAYSGHGITDSTQSFLLLSQARNLNDKQNAINVSIVRNLVGNVVDAGHQVLVLLNACYGGTFLSRSFAPTLYIPRNPGAHAITAGGTNERTWHDPALGNGSVFFEKLFAGLGGLADSAPVRRDGSRGDGVISYEELASYLTQEIRIFTDQRQNPKAGDISRNGSGDGGFFFLNRGRQLKAGVVTDWNSNRAIAFGETFTDGNFIKGKAVFEDSGCVGCHMADSDEKKLGPGLLSLFKRPRMNDGTPVTKENVKAKINSGGNGMPPYGELLSEAEKDLIVFFLSKR